MSAQEPGDPCELAAERVTECYGAEAASAYVCNPDQAEAIAETSCSELSDIETKSDSTLCSALGLFCPADPIFLVDGTMAMASPSTSRMA